MRTGRAAAALALAALVAATAACSTTVAGTGRPAGPDPVAAEAPDPSAAPSPGPAPDRSALDSDVLDDECLLDALQFTALLDRSVLPPEPGELVRPDGTRVTSCVASSASAFPTPLAAINVYAPRTGTPAEFVRAAPASGRRDLPGAGEAAVLIDTAPGLTMQLAGERYVVTIAVIEGAPSDAAWTAAATAALAALPS
jgi:hypothetical protein